jgi:hypothetical protein
MGMLHDPDDEIDEIARAAAVRLSPEFGPRTEAEVAAALFARRVPRAAEQYDPVSVGILIVAIVTLAWTVYSDHRKEHPDAAREVIELTVRSELRREFEATPASVRITEVVITEITERQ